MYYEINVSVNGKHYFATAKRSILTLGVARYVFDDFKKRFPASEGFELSCVRYTGDGEILNWK